MARPTLEELVDPDRTALVFQELQRGVVGEESALPALAEAAREVGVIANALRLAPAAGWRLRDRGRRAEAARRLRLPDG